VTQGGDNTTRSKQEHRRAANQSRSTGIWQAGQHTVFTALFGTFVAGIMLRFCKGRPSISVNYQTCTTRALIDEQQI
jgi:hypothetical protein